MTANKGAFVFDSVSVADPGPVATAQACPQQSNFASRHWPSTAIFVTRQRDRTPVAGLDLTVAILALVFVGPLLLMIAASVWLSGSGPVFYRHTRVGAGGRRFECLKFRTMRADGDKVLMELFARDAAALDEWLKTRKLRQDPRVSRIGWFLRKTSLDELPQLFNVLAGDMSIVGPRPIVEAEMLFYRQYIRHYFAVRPGITGLWQVSGRNHTSYRRRVACDVAYVRSKSLRRDLAIIAMTIPTVLFARGAY